MCRTRDAFSPSAFPLIHFAMNEEPAVDKILRLRELQGHADCHRTFEGTREALHQWAHSLVVAHVCLDHACYLLAMNLGPSEGSERGAVLASLRWQVDQSSFLSRMKSPREDQRLAGAVQIAPGDFDFLPCG